MKRKSIRKDLYDWKPGVEKNYAFNHNQLEPKEEVAFITVRKAAIGNIPIKSKISLNINQASGFNFWIRIGQPQWVWLMGNMGNGEKKAKNRFGEGKAR